MSEKVLLVIVDLKRCKDWPAADVADELKELISSCGGDVKETVFCKILKLSASHLIGEGKVKEIAEACEAEEIDTVIFSHELKGSQQRNLEKAFGKKTIDRTQVILDIFAKHARSREGKMQVELAQLEYLLPRLVGKGIEMSRLGGGIGTLGPGETKLEVDRRRIADRITRLKKQLKEVSRARKLKRKNRREKCIPAISLVGYTNAGKSTLLNALTESEQIIRDGLFTTLDPLSRQLFLGNQQKVILSDTVGFMHELPHKLIEAFKATLEEVVEADLLLHIVDVSHLKFRDYYDSVLNVLEEIGAQDKPVITVFNKIDKVDDRKELEVLIDSFENVVFISAKTNENLSHLNEKLEEFLRPSLVEIHVDIPINRMDLVNLIHKEGHVHSVEYLSDVVRIWATVPPKIAGKF